MEASIDNIETIGIRPLYKFFAYTGLIVAPFGIWLWLPISFQESMDKAPYGSVLWAVFFLITFLQSIMRLRKSFGINEKYITLKNMFKTSRYRINDLDWFLVHVDEDVENRFSFSVKKKEHNLTEFQTDKLAELLNKYIPSSKIIDLEKYLQKKAALNSYFNIELYLLNKPTLKFVIALSFFILIGVYIYVKVTT